MADQHHQPNEIISTLGCIGAMLLVLLVISVVGVVIIRPAAWGIGNLTRYYESADDSLLPGRGPAKAEPAKADAAIPENCHPDRENGPEPSSPYIATTKSHFGTTWKRHSSATAELTPWTDMPNIMRYCRRSRSRNCWIFRRHPSMRESPLATRSGPNARWRSRYSNKAHQHSAGEFSHNATSRQPDAPCRRCSFASEL